MLETCRRQNCERGHTQANQVGKRQSQHERKQTTWTTLEMPLSACGPVTEFKAPGTDGTGALPHRASTSRVRHRIQQPALVRTLKLQNSMHE